MRLALSDLPRQFFVSEFVAGLNNDNLEQ